MMGIVISSKASSLKRSKKKSSLGSLVRDAAELGLELYKETILLKAPNAAASGGVVPAEGRAPERTNLKPQSIPRRARQRRKHVTPPAKLERICVNWREWKSNNPGKRAGTEEWTYWVRLEYAGADWFLVKTVREEVRNYYKAKKKKAKA